MKKVEAIIQPFEVEGVKEGLTRIGLQRFTVTEVKGFGGQAGPGEIYRGMRCEAPYHLEAKLEIIVPDELARGAVAVIRETAQMDEPRGTRIFVSPLDDIEGLPTDNKRAVAA